MQIRHTILLGGGVALGAGLSVPAGAETITVNVAIPRLTVAEYHRPYVALWVEKDGAPARTLSVWYDEGKRNNAGTKWLRDLRTWWRVSGRALTMPADGVSGATRAPGNQTLTLNAPLPAGSYTLVVEAAREAGGREAVRVPFTVAGNGSGRGSATGQFELGAVSLTVKK